jgi:hypothetical protein
VAQYATKLAPTDRIQRLAKNRLLIGFSPEKTVFIDEIPDFSNLIGDTN